MIKQGMQGVICLMTICFFAVQSQAKTITLRYAQQNPDTSWSTTHCVEPWLKQLEEATGGQVKFQAFHGEYTGQGKGFMECNQSGIADIAWICHGYFPGLTPVTDVISLPALPFTSAEKKAARSCGSSTSRPRKFNMSSRTSRSLCATPASPTISSPGINRSNRSRI